MTQRDDLDRTIDRIARDYNDPPPTPRDEMWAGIRRRLGPTAPLPGEPLDLDRSRARAERRRRLRQLGPWGLGLAVAATLAIGFGLGRITTERGLVPADGGAVPADAGASLPVRLATATHLGEAEAMLTMFRTSDRASVGDWARELLATTRLLMDSRAGDDPRMARLLGDLELVLVQIVHAGADAGAVELELIEYGIEQRQLITQLRAASGGPLDIST